MFVTFLNHFDERDIALIFLCFQWCPKADRNEVYIYDGL